MTARLFPSVGERAAACMRKERIFTICVFICAFLLLIVLFCANAGVAYAATEAQEDVEKELSDGVSGAIDRLDTDLFEDFLSSLDDRQAEAVGIGDLKAALKSITDGEPADFFGSFLSALAAAAGGAFLGFLPGVVSVVIICLLKSLLTGMSSGLGRSATGGVVHIVCYSAVIVILTAGVTGVILSVTDTVNALAGFSDAVFPVLLTLLAAVGGGSGVALYQPFMAVLSGTVIKVVQSVIVPAFIAAIVFAVVGNISENVKLGKLAKLVRSGAGWLVGILFGLFATFITAQGISGGVLDKIGFPRHRLPRACQKRRRRDGSGRTARGGAVPAAAACCLHPHAPPRRRRHGTHGRLPHLFRARRTRRQRAIARHRARRGGVHVLHRADADHRQFQSGGVIC